jgi:hypothetical protein
MFIGKAQKEQEGWRECWCHIIPRSLHDPTTAIKKGVNSATLIDHKWKNLRERVTHQKDWVASTQLPLEEMLFPYIS